MTAIARSPSRILTYIGYFGFVLIGWIADRLDYYAFTIGCILLSSAALAVALIVPWLPLAAVCFGFAGLFSGPIYPMIIALGGQALYTYVDDT